MFRRKIKAAYTKAPVKYRKKYVKRTAYTGIVGQTLNASGTMVDLAYGPNAAYPGANRACSLIVFHSVGYTILNAPAGQSTALTTTAEWAQYTALYKYVKVNSLKIVVRAMEREDNTNDLIFMGGYSATFTSYPAGSQNYNDFTTENARKAVDYRQFAGADVQGSTAIIKRFYNYNKEWTAFKNTPNPYFPVSAGAINETNALFRATAFLFPMYVSVATVQAWFAFDVTYFCKFKDYTAL